VDTTLAIEDMTCDRCSDRIVAALRALPGVVEAHVDWRSGLARIRHEDGVSPGDLVQTVAAASVGTRHRYRARPAPPGTGL
jgi:copper chaperone CopZ